MVNDPKAYLEKLQNALKGFFTVDKETMVVSIHDCKS